MKLKELLRILKIAAKKAEKHDVEVEIWQGDRMLEIETISQFGVVPDVVIALKE
jgi:hypothetical protein